MLAATGAVATRFRAALGQRCRAHMAWPDQIAQIWGTGQKLSLGQGREGRRGGPLLVSGWEKTLVTWYFESFHIR